MQPLKGLAVVALEPAIAAPFANRQWGDSPVIERARRIAARAARRP